MNHITILEKSRYEVIVENLDCVLLMEKYLVEDSFDWIRIDAKKDVLIGTGELKINGLNFEISLEYSPLWKLRFEKIFIKNPDIPFIEDIHIYSDKSLCLYHPIIDNPTGRVISLKTMIPWISEWCVHFLEWKKYGVWLGSEIMH